MGSVRSRSRSRSGLYPDPEHGVWEQHRSGSQIDTGIKPLTLSPGEGPEASLGPCAPRFRTGSWLLSAQSWMVKCISGHHTPQRCTASEPYPSEAQGTPHGTGTDLQFPGPLWCWGPRMVCRWGRGHGHPVLRPGPVCTHPPGASSGTSPPPTPGATPCHREVRVIRTEGSQPTTISIASSCPDCSVSPRTSHREWGTPLTRGSTPQPHGGGAEPDLLTQSLTRQMAPV